MIKAIDVSSENGPNIKWGAVAAAGYELVIVRVTKRGLEEDPLCHIHARAARSAGLRVSAYGFSQPSRGGPEAQAQMARAVADDIGAEGLANDAEVDDGLSPEALVAWHVGYHAAADRPGNRVTLYTMPSWLRFSARGFASRLAGLPLWIAQYGASAPDIPAPFLTYSAWQHAANTIAQRPDGSQIWGAKAIVEINAGRARLVAAPGKIDGVAGEIDCNVLAVSINDFVRGVAPKVAPDLRTVLGRQQALRILGRDPGYVDGAWGAASRASLVLVQRDLGLSVDGVWGPRTEVAVRDALVAKGVVAAC